MNIIFGDSFVGLFTLINDDNLYIKKFKGKTIRGISKMDSEDYKILKNIIIDKQKDNKINNIIFMFGQVDIFFSLYYLIFIKKQYNIYDHLQETAENYIKMLLSLDMINNNKKIVFSIFPSLQEDKYAFYILFVYKILKPEELIKIFKKIPNEFINYVFSYKFRNTCRIYLNNMIKKLCEKNNIKYIDFDNILIDKKTNKINKKLNLLVSPVNIHPMFETIIDIYLSKLKFTNIKNKFYGDLDKTKKSYFVRNKEKIDDHNNMVNEIIEKLDNKITKNNKKYTKIYYDLVNQYKKMKEFNKKH